MPTDYIYRRAKPEDRGAILTFQRAAVAMIAAGQYPQALLDAVWATPAPDIGELIDAGRYFVAACSDWLVGGAGWQPYDKESAVIRSVFVHPSHAGRGIGARLVAIAEESAVLADYPRIIVRSALHATGFYAKLGYAAGELRPVALGNGLQGEVRLMWKRAA
ncbi:MAG: GNAT family N-acetyltransferase [Dongiaceae bacterium]